MLWDAWIGGAYQDRSTTIANEVCTNLFVGTVASAENTKRKALYGTPGLKPRLTVGDTGTRGLWTQDGRTFAVIGSTLYEVDVIAATTITRGTVANDDHTVSFASNGRGGEQLAILSGGALSIFDFDTNTFTTPISLPLTHAPVSIIFFAGYFLLVELETPKVWYSALEDGTDWPADQFFARSNISDNLIGLAVYNDRLFTFGSECAEVFFASGDSDNPFLPYPGSIIPAGLVSASALTQLGGGLAFVSQNAEAGPSIVSVGDGGFQRLSTPAVDFALASYGTVLDAEAFSYQQEGHLFGCFTFPSAGVTWCYDTTESRWHQRSTWNQDAGLFERWRARGCCVVNGTVLTGDYSSGAIYDLDLDTFTDNGSMRRWLRRAPYLGADPQWAFIDSIELLCQVGVGLTIGQGSVPLALMRCSRDAGQTWSGAITAPMGKLGEWETRTIWRRLGRTRLDRFGLEISGTDAVRTVLGPSLNMRITPGTGRL